jgi:hypothetical protein
MERKATGYGRRTGAIIIPAIRRTGVLTSDRLKIYPQPVLFARQSGNLPAATSRYSNLAYKTWHLPFYCNCPLQKRFAARRAMRRNLFAEVEWGCALRQFPYPDISETDGLALVAMCLQFDGRAIVLLVVGLADKQSLTDELKVILNQHAI